MQNKNTSSYYSKVLPRTLLIKYSWVTLFFISIILVSLITGCSKDNSYKPLIGDHFNKPELFPEITYNLEDKNISHKGFLLGKKLFFDPRLSLDGSISCNNCHQQSRAFADIPLHPLSIGIDNQMGSRNAPGIFNLAFRNEFFWDGGVTHMDFIAINALESELEMGEILKGVVNKLNKNQEYRNLFAEHFITDSITGAQVLQAFSEFMLQLVSSNSKYDQFLRGEAKLSQKEQEGLDLFEQKCSHCHKGILFTDQSYRNNGISKTFTDLGRADISENKDDEGKFFVPSLRNIEVTAPYMHNAKFNTLEEVLDHYANHVNESTTLDKSLRQDNGKLGIAITQQEQELIIVFLKTLTDYDFLYNSDFQP